MIEQFHKKLKLNQDDVSFVDNQVTRQWFTTSEGQGFSFEESVPEDLLELFRNLIQFNPKNRKYGWVEVSYNKPQLKGCGDLPDLTLEDF